MPNSSKYDKTLMKIAYLWSKESYCKRRQVGAVISKDGREIAAGYNGTVKGKPNICETTQYKCVSCNEETSSPSDLFKIFKEFRPKVSPYSNILVVQCKKCQEESYSDEMHDIPLTAADTDSVVNTLIDETSKIKITKTTNDFVVHAEQNALLFCARLGIPTEGTIMYTTTAPCKECAKFIAQAGIVRVVFDTHYKSTEGIDFLKSCNIQVDGPA